MKLPITYYGNPILRTKAKAVTKITDEIRELVANMIDTMQLCDAYGIAAPQVGHSLAIFVTSPPIQGENGEYAQAAPRVFINPKLSNPSKETWVFSEGCLSIPKIYPDIERPVSITVTALDIDGKEFTETLIGWPAKVVMHENDHINGVLMVDRLSAKERKVLDANLRGIKKKYNS